MQIKHEEILADMILGIDHDAAKFVKSKEEALTIEDIKTMRHSPLSTEFGVKLVQNMILYAIINYHNQLRTKLLENNIDIGEMDLESHDLIDAIIERQSEML